MTTNEKHDKEVQAFFDMMRRKDSINFAKVCEKYPTLSSWNERTIKQREVPSGLLGQEGENE